MMSFAHSKDSSKENRLRILWSRFRMRQWLAVAIGLVVLAPTSVEAAQLVLSSRTPTQNISVGGYFDIDIQIVLNAPMGPGNVDVTLNWGAERANPNTLGAVEFITLPSVVAPSISLALGPDCGASAGLLVGTCSLVATFDSAVPSGTTTIATFTAAYLWVPMDGYELCVSASDPGCVAANQLATLLANNISVFGEVPPVYDVQEIPFQTFAMPAVRPIPEPATSTLIGVGLAVLAAKRRETTAGL